LLLLLCAAHMNIAIGSACFTQSEPMSTERPVRKEIDPCATIADCGKACTEDVAGRDMCDAYAYMGTKCVLLGKILAEGQLMLRSTGCECLFQRTVRSKQKCSATETPTASATTESTTESATSETTEFTPIETTTSASATTVTPKCGKVWVEMPPGCAAPTCTEPTVTETRVTCADGT
ncbi:hypothetical protein PFISCL1PPCAC_13449, partial [Pristionchus fissidentatus]